jgi:hypothetical protein
MGLLDVGTIKSGLLGPSSSAYFSNQLRDIVESQHPSAKDAHRVWNATRLSDFGPGRPLIHSDYIIPISSLPPKIEADRLMANYWSRNHFAMPILDRESFESSYNAMWLGSELNTDPIMFHCLLYAIFALSSQDMSDKTRVEHIEDSMAYFNQCRQLLKFDIFTGSVLSLRDPRSRLTVLGGHYSSFKSCL